MNSCNEEKKEDLMQNASEKNESIALDIYIKKSKTDKILLNSSIHVINKRIIFGNGEERKKRQKEINSLCAHTNRHKTHGQAN